MEDCVTSDKYPHLGGNIPGGDPFTYCSPLWRWLVSKYVLDTVLDVGCGTGEALQYFYRLGCQTLGVEGLQENADKCNRPIIVADLTKSPIIITGINLVWCCEVVEHIEKRHIHNLLATISQGKILAMTHAEPMQDGYHHVNCQPAEYWIKALKLFNMEYLPEETKYGKSLLPEKNHFAWHGLIFRKKV